MRQIVFKGTARPASLSKLLLSVLFTALLTLAFALMAGCAATSVGHADEPVVDDALVVQGSSTAQGSLASTDTIWSSADVQASDTTAENEVDSDGSTSWQSVDDPEVVFPNVATPTQEEIIARMAQDDVMLGIEDTYEIESVYNTQMGKLSDETKRLGLGMLNTIRFIVGLDDVVLDDDYSEMAQAAAFVDSSISTLTHHPELDGSKPEGMPNDVWELGCYGTSHSNMACGFTNLSTTLVEGWMSDSDFGNVGKVGHRRWCLNPNMGATGFGATEWYYAMYGIDESGNGTQSNVVWPAQNMPCEFFDSGDAWSISVGEYIEASSEVRVTLTRKNDGKVWVFDELEASSVDGHSKCFYINNDYCGQPGCIIFRPDDISYKPGDEFHVEAANVNGTTIVYDVKFFKGLPLSPWVEI